MVLLPPKMKPATEEVFGRFASFSPAPEETRRRDAASPQRLLRPAFVAAQQDLQRFDVGYVCMPQAPNFGVQAPFGSPSRDPFRVFVMYKELTYPEKPNDS